MLKEKGGEKMDEHPMDFESMEFALRHSWEVHRQAFGPILEPAFQENQQVRLPTPNPKSGHLKDFPEHLGQTPSTSL